MDDDESNIFSQLLRKLSHSIIKRREINDSSDCCNKDSFVVSLYKTYIESSKKNKVLEGDNKCGCKSEFDNKCDSVTKATEPEEEKIPPSNNTVHRCFIREQNPLSPCCCSPVNDDDDQTPCPPSDQQESRSPTCGCDLCDKNGYHCQCCDRKTFEQTYRKISPKFETI